MNNFETHSRHERHAPSCLDDLEAAYEVVRRGGLLLIQHDIGYGLTGHSERSIRLMYQLKGRSERKPCVVPGDIDILTELCPSTPPMVIEWIRAQTEWTTLAVVGTVNAASALWRSLPPWVRRRSSRKGSVAVFLRPGTFVNALVRRATRDGRLLVGSSGNLSGEGNCFRPEALAPRLVNGVDLFLDHGVAVYENPQRLATTMVDLRTLAIIRRGVNAAEIEAELQGLRTCILGGADGDDRERNNT